MEEQKAARRCIVAGCIREGTHKAVLSIPVQGPDGRWTEPVIAEMDIGLCQACIAGMTDPRKKLLTDQVWRFLSNMIGRTTGLVPKRDMTAVSFEAWNPVRQKIPIEVISDKDWKDLLAEKAFKEVIGALPQKKGRDK